MKQQLDAIIEVVRAHNGNRQWVLTDPITVRLTPHTHPLEIYGLCVSPKNELFLMTEGFGEEIWTKLETTDLNANKVINSVYQRVMITYAKAPIH